MNLIIKIILLLSISFSQTIVVQVLEEDKNYTLSGANIVITSKDETELGCSPNEDGICIFKNLPYGIYNVSVSFIGYETLEKSVTVSDDIEYKVNCLMKVKTILYPELKIISDKNSPYKKLSGSASVIDLKSINQIRPIGTQEMLEHIPGIHAFPDDGIGNSRISIGIRGLNPRRSSRVLILEDGIPIQPALYVYPNMYYNPPVERIDGMQVIKGSASIKYGPQTMGGVINYYTRRPKNLFASDITIAAGENGYKSVFTEINSGLINGSTNAIQLLYKAGDGFRENNGFEQINATFKTSYNYSKDKNLYLKIGSNYENSNATYTGLTEYSFEKDPTFNPKKYDNFRINRVAIDMIETYKITKSFVRTRKLFSSYFDRRWWRETDMFARASDPTSELDEIDIDKINLGDVPYDDIIRVGNGETNFGILRTFYVLGYEQTYKFNRPNMNNSSTEIGTRVYWERFIDDKKIGNSPNDRLGIYYYDGGDTFTDCDVNCEIDFCEGDIGWIDGVHGNGVWDLDEEWVDVDGNGKYNKDPDRVGQSHHYETTAFSAFISNTSNFSFASINSGLRLELFEQERIDRLNGAIYLDKTSIEILPSISFIKEFNFINLFGGIHRGYTSPSSGALKVSNFASDAGLDLKSEKSWNKEFGIRTENLFSFLNFDFSFFHIDIKNLVAAGRGTAFKNLGEVTMMGTELAASLSYKKYPVLPIIHFTHTFLDAKIKSATLQEHYFMGDEILSIKGNRLPYAPKNAFIIGIEQNLFKKLNIRFNYKYVGPVFTDFHNIGDDNLRLYEQRGSWDNTMKIGIRGPVPSYGIFNANVNFNINKNIDMNLSIKNLTDEIYIGSRLHSNPNQKSPNLSSGIIPGPRRQINFSIKYSI